MSMMQAPSVPPSQTHNSRYRHHEGMTKARITPAQLAEDAPEFMLELTPRSLYLLRHVHGFSRAELSERSGVAAVYIEQLEKGLRINPSDEIVVNLSRALGVKFFRVYQTF
jgi:DNA-binding XRE family transcriptional regulator